MDRRRLRTAAGIVGVVAAMLVVWWLDRGDDRIRKVDAPRDPPITRVEPAPAPTSPPPIEISWISDPHERATVLRVAQQIDRGGPYDYRKDGSVFENRERRLPKRPPSYWREYTVATPGEDDRGARRLVAGERHELYYSRDHYQSFTALRGATP